MYREIYSRYKDFLFICVGYEFELVSILNLYRLFIYEKIEWIYQQNDMKFEINDVIM